MIIIGGISLQGRSELKYILTYTQFLNLKGKLDFLLPRDKFLFEKKNYNVLSKYYDNQTYDFFYQKVNGEEKHLKIRLRTYDTKFDESSSGFLEAKMKDGFIQKKIRIERNNLSEYFNPTSWNSLEEPDLNFFEMIHLTKNLYPTCNVFYKRDAYDFHSGSQRIRINFDTDICALFPYEDDINGVNLQNRRILKENEVLMECKYDKYELPRTITELIATVESKHTTFSKYASTILKLNEIMNVTGATI